MDERNPSPYNTRPPHLRAISNAEDTEGLVYGWTSEYYVNVLQGKLGKAKG